MHFGKQYLQAYYHTPIFFYKQTLKVICLFKKLTLILIDTYSFQSLEEKVLSSTMHENTACSFPRNIILKEIAIC